MRHALSSTNNRQIELIELLRTSNNYLPVKIIAKKVDAVPKTVLSDCLEIEDQWSDIVQIEKNSSGDLHLTEKDNHTVHEIFSDILKESPTFQLLEILFFHPGILRTDLEKELFLSSSSLYRRIVKLNDGLEKRGLQIDRNNLTLIGDDEQHVRVFMAEYFLEVYDVYEWPFELDQKMIFAIVDRFNQQFKLELNFLQKTEFAFLIAVSLIRQKQGFFTASKRGSIPVPHLENYLAMVRDLMTQFSLPITEKGQNDLIQSIFWYDFAWDNPEEEARIERLCDSMLALMVNALGISIPEQSHTNCVLFLKSIYTSYKTYPYEKYIAYNRELYSSLTIQRDFAVFTKVLEKTLKDQEAKSRFPWYSMYFHIILFKLFIYWDDLPQQLDNLRQPVSTEVCSDLGVKHAQLLAYYLEKNYHGKVLLDVQPNKVYSEVAPDSLQSDLYVTNFTTPIIPKEKLFVLEDIPTAKKLSSLGRKIEEYRMNTLIQQLSYLN